MPTTLVRPSGASGRITPPCPNCGRPMHHDTVRSGGRDVFKCGECGISALRSARNAEFANAGAAEAPH